MRRSGLRVAIESLGDWGSARLVSEYDPESDTIRIDARAVDAVVRAGGRELARAFVVCAVAHEIAHAIDPRCTEAEAHAFAAAACGADPAAFEALVRA